MDRAKFFWLRGRYHLIDNPISEAKLDDVIERLLLPPEGRVLDIACGKAEMLCRIAARYSARCTGVERNAHFCDEAKAKLEQRGLAGLIEIRQMNGQDFETQAESFDAAMCIGAEWVFGGLRGTLAALSRWTRPGGVVVVGTPFWSMPPTAEYLQTARLSADDFSTHKGNVKTGEELGLTLTYTTVSSHDDWDRYTALSWSAAYDYVREHPDDADAAEIVDATERDKAGYFSGGRDCLGWGIYVFRK